MANIPLTITGLKEAKADLAALDAQFEKFKNDPIQSKKIAKEFNDLSKAVDEATEELTAMNAAGKLLGVRFDDLNETLFNTQEEVLPLTSQIGEMEDRMYQLAAAGQAGNAEFMALQEETARLRKVIIDTDKSVDLLAENQGLSVFATGLGQVGESILRLDFTTAEKDAKALNAAVGNLGQIGAKSIKGMIGTVGQLTKAFVKLGVSLLANPIFLIVAAVTAIVAAIGILLDKLGLLQPILDAIGYAFQLVGEFIDGVVQSIKDFLDWIGLTDFAGEEAAQALIDRNQRILESERSKNEEISSAMDHEIALRQARGEETTELERKKLERIRAAKEAEIQLLGETAKAMARLHGVESEEFKEALQNVKDSVKAFKEAGRAIEVFDAQQEKRQKDNAEKAAEERAAEAKNAAEKAKQFAADRLAAEREIEDLRLQMIADDNERELALLDTQYQRKIEDVKTNEKLLASEREQLVNALLLEQQVKRSELEAKQQQEEQSKEKARKDEELKRLVESQNIADEIEIQLIKDQFEREAAERQAAFDKRIADLQEKGLLTNEIEKGLKQQLVNDLQAIDDAAAAEKDANRQKELDAEKSINDAKVKLAIQGFQLVAGVADLFADKSETAAKIAFNANKAAQIAQATTDGYRAVLSAFANTPGGVVIQGLAAGFAGAFAATQIAKIASTKFESSSSGAAGNLSASTPAGGLQAASTTPAQPSFNLFGQANDQNNLSASQGVETQTQEITVNAVVSETEVTNTQNRIKKLTQAAAL